jgi:predicted SnoaL-like aldol condensation-catalyzing enzyme
MAPTLVRGAAVVSATTALIPGADPVEGQTTPVIAADHEAMLASADAMLERNKRLCYDMYRIVLQAGRADRVPEFIGAEYIQHNPNVVSGPDALAAFIRASRPEREIKPKIELPLVSIVAERDMVLFAFVRPERDADGTLYHTSWFDLFRIEDGKIVEHWDPALKSPEMLKLDPNERRLTSPVQER